MAPEPQHKIYQNTLIYEELLNRGWNLQFNKPDNTTDLLFCTSNSQTKRTSEASLTLKRPYITWICDIGREESPEAYNLIVTHIQNAWRVMSICTKMQWEIIKRTGRYRVDLVRPCIDNHTIAKVLANFTLTKKNQIVVVGAMHAWKEPHIPFLAWKELPEPRPDLIYITYGKKANGLMYPQLAKEAEGLNVSFIDCEDEEKFKIIAESKLLICADSFGGFNLPPIEAYFCGTPSLISDAHWVSDLDCIQFTYIWDLMEKMAKEWKLNNTGRMEQYTIESCCDRLEAKFKEWGITK